MRFYLLPAYYPLPALSAYKFTPHVVRSAVCTLDALSAACTLAALSAVCTLDALSTVCLFSALCCGQALWGGGSTVSNPHDVPMKCIGCQVGIQMLGYELRSVASTSEQPERSITRLCNSLVERVRPFPVAVSRSQQVKMATMTSISQSASQAQSLIPLFIYL